MKRISKNCSRLLCLALIFLAACNSGGTGKPGSTETSEVAGTEGSTLSGSGFGSLFTGSPDGDWGVVGCETQNSCVTHQNGTYNGNWNSYFQYDGTSMTITAGNDCRTLNTGSNNSCVFELGDNGITQIKFDFEISDPCHNDAGTDWLSFWIYTRPWANTAEVDFIEGCNGPANGGLNMNFAGVGNQSWIFEQGTPGPWKGTVTSTFTGTGNSVKVSIANSVNSNVATSTLSVSTGYFFVLDATPTTENGCTVKISNVTAKGKVDTSKNSTNCNGLTIIQ